MGTLIISCSGLITCIFQNLEIKNLHHQSLRYCNSTRLYQRIQNLFLLAQLFVILSFYLSVSSCYMKQACDIKQAVSSDLLL